jgi:cyclopropane fatty-acyl-phospholipid synthase-like methyltransferase
MNSHLEKNNYTRWGCLKSLLPVASKLTFVDKLKMLGRPLISPLPFLLRYLRSNDCMFDIGCGSGALLHLAIKQADVSVADGCEISDTLIANVAKLEHSADIATVIKITQDTPLPSLTKYTLVTAIDVLHHILPKKQTAFFEEIIKRTKKGTRLILADINAEKPIGSFLNRLHDLVLAKQWVYPWPATKVLNQLEKLGWKINHCSYHRNLWYPHYVIVAERI